MQEHLCIQECLGEPGTTWRGQVLEENGEKAIELKRQELGLTLKLSFLMGTSLVSD